MTKPNPREATADYPPSSNVDQVEEQTASSETFQNGSIDWLKLVTLVFLGTLILRFDYLAVSSAFTSLSTSVPGFFGSQSAKPEFPSASPHQSIIDPRPIDNSMNNDRSQRPTVRYEVLHYRSCPTENRSNCQ